MELSTKYSAANSLKASGAHLLPGVASSVIATLLHSNDRGRESGQLQKVNETLLRGEKGKKITKVFLPNCLRQEPSKHESR